MPQSKFLRISLLVAVFVLSAVFGYILEGMLFVEELAVEENFAAQEVQYLDDEEEIAMDSDSLCSADTVMAEDTVLIEEPKPVVYRKFTQSQMEDLLNSGDFERRPDDSKYIFSEDLRVTVLNKRSDDRAVSGLSDVCSKIGMFWTGVTVNRIVYNPVNNQILEVVITAHYPDENNE